MGALATGPAHLGLVEHKPCTLWLTAVTGVTLLYYVRSIVYDHGSCGFVSGRAGGAKKRETANVQDLMFRIDGNVGLLGSPGEQKLFDQIKAFVRKGARRQYKKLRATLSNALADHPVERNGETGWVENPAKRIIHGIYDVVSEPLRSGHWAVPRMGTDKTAYVIGLYGTGRWYIHALMRQNLGERAKYIRQRIRFHPRPTSMIYTGHATLKYASRGQRLPTVSRRILEARRAGFADLIFVYRHPLDSLLTNWLWWRTYLREKRIIGSISEIYKTMDELYAGLEEDFQGFKAFAEGDPSFFAAAPGPPFLSFSQFVEETSLYIQASTLAVRLEDFADNPRREFLRIIELLSGSVECDLRNVSAPKAKPYKHRAVQENVPKFREFTSAIDPQTKRRIEEMGYS
jgi:hypothetical protein